MYLNRLAFFFKLAANIVHLAHDRYGRLFELSSDFAAAIKSILDSQRRPFQVQL